MNFLKLLLGRARFHCRLLRVCVSRAIPIVHPTMNVFWYLHEILCQHWVPVHSCRGDHARPDALPHFIIRQIRLVVPDRVSANLGAGACNIDAEHGRRLSSASVGGTRELSHRSGTRLSVISFSAYVFSSASVTVLAYYPWTTALRKLQLWLNGVSARTTPSNRVAATQRGRRAVRRWAGRPMGCRGGT
jgi:hypothetical protein